VFAVLARELCQVWNQVRLSATLLSAITCREFHQIAFDFFRVAKAQQQLQLL
jgi:hypothetical protein